MNKELQQSIKQTLAYFDTFDYPLTFVEIHKWLWKPDGIYTIEQVYTEVCLLKNNNTIYTLDGFYFFKEREEIVEKRQSAVLLVKQKIAIAKRASRIVRFVPFVTALFVCNTVAGSIPSQYSDIDVLIVTKDKHIWVCRFLITVLLFLFRLRRTTTKIDNKICLSFYITQSAIDFNGIQLTKPDIYLAYWIDQLIPLYDPTNFLTKIYLKNTWVHKKIPNGFVPPMLHSDWIVKDTVVSASIRWMISIPFVLFGIFVENIFKKIQKRKMIKNIGSIQHEPDSRVIISDTMLKFHENDRRIFFKQRWIKRCKELGL